ncbi:MAG: hypothetical protein RMI89_02980 [Gloeomargarita sp. SKYBB_i_bin120]|nr:hypothetical protein [Gloeomargarita sp. SKYG98]MCS7291925.1 hypothetical protein [Gloeomargarita sp. SKYB120]MDW8177485.1 hypothetical protein [Gloeomargarita sp. SKYBB_i_bin120]
MKALQGDTAVLDSSQWKAITHRVPLRDLRLYEPKPWRKPTLADVEAVVRLLETCQDSPEALAEICLDWLRDWPPAVKRRIWTALESSLQQKVLTAIHQA